MSGIEVAVSTEYLPDQSDPDTEQYAFAYTITIANRGSEPGQLLNRHWLITDATGHTEEVRGPGVVGEQPRLGPGEAYSYTSGAVLKTPVGAMEGSYEFVRDDQTPFQVPIPAFSLSVSNMVH